MSLFSIFKRHFSRDLSHGEVEFVKGLKGGLKMRRKRYKTGFNNFKKNKGS